MRGVIGEISLVLSLLTLVHPKHQYTQPMNFGLQISIPYDIANIFSHPISGVISVVLSIGLAFIIFFGIITSPFGYFFGIPSRKYVLGRIPKFEPTVSRSFGGGEYSLDGFWLIPDDYKSPECRLLTTCVAHGVFRHLPRKAIKLYTFFSKNLVGIDKELEEAVLLGITDSSLCDTRYNSCNKSVFSIIVSTMAPILPNGPRRKTKPNFSY